MNAIEKLRLRALSTCEKDNSCINCQTEELFDISDRIEAEYMELPRDKNGEVIHVGDTITYVCWEFNATNIVIAIIDSHEVLLGGYCYVNASEIELVKPDSMERIKADAAKSLKEYWGCVGYKCDDCPSRIEGETPDRHFDVFCCDDALRIDLIARTEKLLEGEL